jgi:hypothetical protein
VLTPTTCAPAPIANSISVTLGTRETIRPALFGCGADL